MRRGGHRPWRERRERGGEPGTRTYPQRCSLACLLATICTASGTLTYLSTYHIFLPVLVQSLPICGRCSRLHHTVLSGSLALVLLPAVQRTWYEALLAAGLLCVRLAGGRLVSLLRWCAVFVSVGLLTCNGEMTLYVPQTAAESNQSDGTNRHDLLSCSLALSLHLRLCARADALLLLLLCWRIIASRSPFQHCKPELL